MTLSDLANKTPEELNAMCAEALGWIYGPYGGVNRWYNLRFGEGAMAICDPPNYTGSGDAIMPEVRKLNMKQSFDFIEHLRAVLDIKATGEYAYTWMMLTATAQQLTIALILTLTK